MLLPVRPTLLWLRRLHERTSVNHLLLVCVCVWVCVRERVCVGECVWMCADVCE